MIVIGFLKNKFLLISQIEYVQDFFDKGYSGYKIHLRNGDFPFYMTCDNDLKFKNDEIAENPIFYWRNKKGQILVFYKPPFGKKIKNKGNIIWH